MTVEELATAVEAEALARYEEGGWDVLVECWSLEDYRSYWADREQDGETFPTTVGQAIESVRGLVAIWADRQADARNSAF